MLDQLHTWWQTWRASTPPETQALLHQGGVALAALLGGHLLGSIVARFLRARNFDAVLGVSGPPAGAEEHRGLTPAFVAGVLVRLTVWAAAGAWLARQHGRAELADTLGLVIQRGWALAGVLVAALAVAGLVARRLTDCLQGLPGVGPARNGAAGPARGVAGALAAGVYGLVLLLALLVTADLFDWPLTRTSAQALWQLAQHLLVASAALFIGVLGARWALDLVTAEAATPEKQAGQYTALGVVAASTVLAVGVLVSSASLLFGLSALAALGCGLWLVRRHLPDVAAGLQLRTQKVREVELEGAAWQVSKVGLVASDVSRAGAFHRLQNRQVLESRSRGERAGAGAR